MQKIFNANCQKITNEEYTNMQDVVWICLYCSNQQTEGRFEGMQFFKRYVEELICTVRGDRDECLKITISLHKNLQSILEKVNMEVDLGFHDIHVNVSSKSNITCHCYQKPTDTEIIPKFCSCARLQLKKTVIRGTVNRDLRRHLIGCLSISCLKRTKHAGKEISIQMSGLQK